MMDSGNVRNIYSTLSNKFIQYLFRIIGLLPGGIGYFTCIQNKKSVNKT